MTYESIGSQGKPIFRETFQSEQQTRRNGGVPTDVVFEGGDASPENTAGHIDYGTNVVYQDGLWTFKVNFTTPDVLVNYMGLFGKSTAPYETRGFLSTGAIYFYKYNSAGVNEGAAVWVYNTEPNTKYTLVFTAVNATDMRCYMNGVYLGEVPNIAGGARLNFNRLLNRAELDMGRNELDLAEIYNYAWTDEQALNDYNNATYKDVRKGIVLDIDSRQGVIEDKMGNDIVVGSGIAIKKRGTFSHIFADISTSSIIYTFPQTTNIENYSICFWINVDRLVPGSLQHIVYTTGVIRDAYINGTSGTYASSFGGDKYLFGATTETGQWRFIVESGLSASNVDSMIFLEKYQSLHGVANQIRLYNRVLSDEEMMQLYTSSKNNYNG